MIATLDTRPIEALLASRIGLDPASIGRDEIGRALRRRMAETGCQSLGDYLRLVEGDEEWDELVEHVLIRETWFLREPNAFALLERLARAHLDKGTRQRFRVLSMPCSTGAEPYSIAMTLREAGLPPERFGVEAVDLSRQALGDARRGLYTARVVRLVPPRLLRTYFTPVDDDWQVNADLCRSVRFSRGNVVDPEILRGAPRFDVVFCRNLLIYLDQRARERLLTRLSEMLRDEGLLVTGHAETSNVVAPLFVSVRVPRTFAYERSSAAHARGQVVSDAARAGPVPLTPTFRRARSSPARQSWPVQSAGPGKQGAARAEKVANSHEQDLAPIWSLADAGRLAEAIAACQSWLEAHPSSTEGQFLLGVTASAAGHAAVAERALRRVLYLDPLHEGALLHLAALRERSGDNAEAVQLRRRARGTQDGGGPRR